MFQAVDEVNMKMINGRNVFVGRAQKKKERQMELQRKYDAEKYERYSRYSEYSRVIVVAMFS